MKPGLVEQGKFREQENGHLEWPDHTVPNLSEPVFFLIKWRQQLSHKVCKGFKQIRHTKYLSQCLTHEEHLLSSTDSIIMENTNFTFVDLRSS